MSSCAVACHAMLRCALSCPVQTSCCISHSQQPLKQDIVAQSPVSYQPPFCMMLQHAPPAFQVVHCSYHLTWYFDCRHTSVQPPRVCEVQLAKQQLETALRSAQRESMLITDSELAEVHYKLGRICWTMGGNQLTDPTQARAHLVAATQHDSEIQVCPLMLCVYVLLALHLSHSSPESDLNFTYFWKCSLWSCCSCMGWFLH